MFSAELVYIAPYLKEGKFPSPTSSAASSRKNSVAGPSTTKSSKKTPKPTDIRTQNTLQWQ